MDAKFTALSDNTTGLFQPIPQISTRYVRVRGSFDASHQWLLPFSFGMFRPVVVIMVSGNE